jgi:hypothetical protein
MTEWDENNHFFGKCESKILHERKGNSSRKRGKKITSIFWIARGGLDARKEHQPCGV